MNLISVGSSRDYYPTLIKQIESMRRVYTVPHRGRQQEIERQGSRTYHSQSSPLAKRLFSARLIGAVGFTSKESVSYLNSETAEPSYSGTKERQRGTSYDRHKQVLQAGPMMPVNHQSGAEVELKVDYMVKRSQGKSALGATNFKKRVFVLTQNRLSYYDGNLEVSQEQ